MRKASVALLVLLLPLVIGAWVRFHIELRASFPVANQVLDEAPEEIWLEFSTTPDTGRSTFSVRGPQGSVQLDTIRWRQDEGPTILRAKVLEEMPAGEYTVSWMAAPVDDHGGRGRFGFSVAGKH